jgi:enoyl-CoA hydratase/carnithine racemase
MTGSVDISNRQDGVYILSFCNSKRKNALDDAMIAQLQAHLDCLANDPGCRLVVFDGDGDDFCAGRDIAQLNLDGMTPAEMRPVFHVLNGLFEAIHNFPKPTLSVVRGYCLGLGAAIAALSDIAFAAEDARFGFPEVKVGISPSFTTIALLQNVGLKAATHLLLTGITIDGKQAEKIGLVTQAVPPGDLEAVATSCIDSIAGGSPAASAMCKKLIRASVAGDFPSALDIALNVTIAAANTPDAREGRAAFREKRPPSWEQPA